MAGLETKLAEVTRAVQDGADEVDMVISRGRFLSGDYDYVSGEIARVKQACGRAHLKVILETGELVTLDNVRAASCLAMAAGADFIKTSTGKVQPAATPEARRATESEVNDAVGKLNDFAAANAAALNFSKDQDTGKTIIKVVDTATDTVIRQIPSEEAIAIAKSIDKMQGLLIKEKA